MKLNFNFSLSLGNNIARPLKSREFVSAGFAEAERLAAEQRFSTASNYQTALRSLCRFLDAFPQQYSTLTENLLQDYRRWLLGSGVCQNTAGCYFRSLRAIYNKQRNPPVKESSSRTIPDIFANIPTAPCTTRKRAISIQEIRTLQTLDLSRSPSLAFARDLFLFSFYCMGMPFVDMAYLASDSICDGKLLYWRKKTGRCVCVPLEACAIKILQRYSSENEYAFPLLKKEADAKSLHRQLRVKLRWYNYSLRRLSSIAGLRTNLSSYVARHTWASIAYSRNVGVNVISQALGHASTKVTSIYIKDLQPSQLRDAIRRVLSAENEDSL